MSIVPSWQVGLVVGTGAALASTQPSLMPRSREDHVKLTGAAAVLGFAMGSLLNLGTVRPLAGHVKGGELGARLVITAGGAVIAGAIALGDDDTPSTWTSAVQTIALVASATAGAGLLLHGEKALASRLASHLPMGKPGAHGLMAAAGLAAIAGAVLAIRHGMDAPADVFGAMHDPPPSDVGAPTVDDLLATESGGDGSHIGFDTLDKYGRRFVLQATPSSVIEEVVGESALDPIRIYAGLRSAPTATERAELVIREMHRLGAFDRSRVVLAQPTGTGSVNNVMLEAEELLSRGDVALVALQYGDRPSIQSLHRLDEAQASFEILLRRIHEEIERLPADRRPELAIFGESLAGWTTQDIFLHGGLDAIRTAGVDRALWLGSPALSTFRAEALREASRSDTPDTMELERPASLAALSPHQRSRLRYVFVTHPEDPVHRIEPRLAWQEPQWLRGDRHPMVPSLTRWIPGITLLQVVLDTENATSARLGSLASFGHDYRADLVPIMRDVFGHRPVTDAQFDRIQARLGESEINRRNWFSRGEL